MCIQKINQEAQEKIKTILEQCKKSTAHRHITEKWLAEKLGLTRSTISFQLTMAENFSIGMYEEIILILRKEGVVKDSSQSCKILNNALLETQTTMFHQLELITLCVKNIGADGKYEEHEKPIMKQNVENIRKAINEQLDKMIEDIEA